MKRRLLSLCLLLATISLVIAGGSRVMFDDAGNALVNGRPFFPIGLFTYSLDEPTIAEIRKQSFNTVALKPVKNRFTEKLGPYDTRAYTWGNEPQDSR